MTVFETYEYDVEYTAPVDLRVLDINFDLWQDWRRLPQESWIFKVQVLQPSQLSALLPEEEYVAQPKMM